MKTCNPNWMLLFIGNLCWKHPPLEKLSIKVEAGFSPWTVSSRQGFIILGKQDRDLNILSSFDLQQGCQLWTKTLKHPFLSLSVCRDERLLITQNNQILILEHNQIRRLSTGILCPGLSPCLTDNGQQIVAVKASGDLVAWDLNSQQKWQWTPPKKQFLSSPIPQSDGSVILVVSSVELYRVAFPGLVLENWLMGENTRLYIKGRVEDDQLFIQSTTSTSHPSLFLLCLKSRKLNNLGDLVVIYPHGDATTPYVTNLSTGKIATIYSSRLVNKLRSPNPKFGRFPHLPPNSVGIYGNLKSGLIVAADEQGKKLWNLTIPQKRLSLGFCSIWFSTSSIKYR